MAQIVLDGTGPLKSTLVDVAYGFCGLSGDQFERTPDEMLQGLRLLNGLMGSLKLAQNIDLGYDFPIYGDGLLEEPSGIPPEAQEAVCALLAQRIAPTIGASLTDDAKAILSNVYQDLLAAYAPAPPSRLSTYRMLTLAMRRRLSICPTSMGGTPTPTPTPTPVPVPPPVVTPPNPGTLAALSLSASSIPENSPAGTVVGAIRGLAASSALSLSDDAGGRFAISNGNIVAGAVPTDYETATFHNITIVETLATASNSPNSTTLAINVANVPEITLTPLTGTFSLLESDLAGAVAGTLSGITPGSTLALVNDAGGRVSLSGSNIIRGATALDYETATSHSFTVRETNPNGINSPNDTTLTLTVVNVFEQPTLTALTGSLTIPENSPAGTVVGIPTGYASGSTKSLSNNAGGRFAIDAATGQITVANGLLLDYETNQSHSITVVETLPDSPNSPLSTTLTVSVTNVNDTNPSAFTFTDTTGQALGSTQTSNTITISGMSSFDAATATVSGDPSSRISKNGGSFVVGPVTVVNGDTLAVRHTASSGYSATVNTVLTVGATSDTFSSTTLAASGLSAGSIAFDSANGWSTGQNPPAIQITLPADGSIQVGDWYRIEYATNSGFTTGDTFTAWHQIASDDVLNSVETGGFLFNWGSSQLATGATWFRLFFGRGASAGSITSTSPASNVINDTLAAPTATVALIVAPYGTSVPTDKAKFNQVSSPGLALVMGGSVGSPNFVRGNKYAVATKFRLEWVCNGWAPSNSAIYFGFDDRQIDFANGNNPYYTGAFPGGAVVSGTGPYNGITFTCLKGATSVSAARNGSGQTLTGVPGGLAANDRIALEVDRSANTIAVFHVRGTTQTSLGTVTLTSQIPTNWYPFAGVKNGNLTATDGVSDCLTMQPDTSQWAVAASAGFNQVMA